MLLAACTIQETEPGELTPYINPTLGFRIDYPDNWNVSTDPANLVGSQPDKVHAVAFASLSSRAVVVVYVETLERVETLTEFVTRQMDNIRSTAGDIVFSDPLATELGGREAFVTEATLTENGQTLRQRALLAVNGNQGYAVSAVSLADSSLAGVLDAMLASFGFIP
jgi:hypothetical protein